MTRKAAVRIAGWALLCAAVPLAARALLSRAIDAQLEPALEDALGVPVAIGDVEADLSGTVRLESIAVGDAMTAGAIEVSVEPEDLLSGSLAPAEILVVTPRLRLALAPGGGSNLDAPLARLRERLARRRASAPASPAASRLRRVVIERGDVAVDLPGRGRLTASGVRLHPTARGLRVTTGAIAATWADARWGGAARFERAAVDVDLPRLDVHRLLAVRGAAQLGGARFDQVTASAGPGARTVRASARTGSGTVALELDRPARRADLALTRASLAALAPLAPAGLDLAAATATGDASLALAGSGLGATIDLHVDATVDGVRVAPGLLADRPVALDGALAGDASLRRAAGRILLAVDSARLTRGGVTATATGRAEWAPGAVLPARAELRVEVPETSCQAALAAVPDAMRDALGGLDADGALSASAALRFDRSAPELTDLDLDLDVGGCRVLVEPALSDPRSLAEPFDLRLPDGRTVRVGEGPDFAPLATLPRHVVTAFVAAEDARFFQHHGFDPEQIERSLAIDLAEGELLRGGSTMTQQLVKNVFLGQERTVARKLQEAVLTWRLEARASKQLILERYLNILELGEADVTGIGAAARHWFGVPAARLTVRQAAFLAALTPAPRTLSRRIREHGGLDDAMLARVDLVLRAMRQDGFIDRGTFERARVAPLHLAPTSLAAR